MFNVIIGSKMHQADDPIQACRAFFWKINDMRITAPESVLENILRDCRIETVLDGERREMGIHSVRAFSRAVGILDAEGELRTSPLFVSDKYARKLFLAHSKKGIEA